MPRLPVLEGVRQRRPLLCSSRVFGSGSTEPALSNSRMGGQPVGEGRRAFADFDYFLPAIRNLACLVPSCSRCRQLRVLLFCHVPPLAR